MRYILTAIVAMAVAAVCQARTIYVDANGTGDYPTIQAAVNDSNTGDTIIVRPGQYCGPGNRDIDFLGKAITVQSIDSNDPCVVDSTIIDCNGTTTEPHRGFHFHNGEGLGSVISGLTIINGRTPLYGGAILCHESSPTISLCRLERNRANRFGGAIVCEGAAPTINECTITNNVANSGGGVFAIGYENLHVEPLCNLKQHGLRRQHRPWHK